MDITMTTCTTDDFGGAAMRARAGHLLAPVPSTDQGTAVFVGRIPAFGARTVRGGYTSVVKTIDVAHPRLGAPPV